MNSGLGWEVGEAVHSCFYNFFFLKSQCCEKRLGEFGTERERPHFAGLLCAPNEVLFINVFI